MKKTFAFLSALLLLISLASCGAAPAQEEEKPDGSESRPAGEFSPAAAADDTLTPVTTEEEVRALYAADGDPFPMKNLSPSMVIAVDLADIIDPCFHALDLVFKDRFVTAEQIYIPRNDTRSIAPCAGTLARSECGDDLGDHTASQELFLIQIV